MIAPRRAVGLRGYGMPIIILKHRTQRGPSQGWIRMTIEAPAGATLSAPSADRLIAAPILPTLMRLAIPNIIAMLGTALVAVAETSYIGRLGTEPLAAIALVFPFSMLTQMMSAGAMGGGVSSAISRALGAGDGARAAVLALHAIIIGMCGGLVFTLVMLVFGSDLYMLLGGRGGVLAEAQSYSVVLFSGAVSIWLVNTLASILRGTGDMVLPSAVLLGIAALQVVIGGSFGLGLFGLPRLGMAGVASGQLIAFTLGALFLLAHLFSGRGRLSPDLRTLSFQRPMFVDILKVGALACLSPLQSVLTILVFTKIVAGFGIAALAGYGIGSRLEFLLIPIAFAFGVASIPMVGMAIGAGLIARARRTAWTAGALSALILGAVGVVLAIWPSLWVSLFTSDPAVTAAAYSYFAWAGPGFAFFGLGVTLYFASQGAAKVGGPVLAATARLVMVAIGGAYLAAVRADASMLFALVAAAMVVYGLGTAAVVRLTRWGA
jgi:putative MATE family efflux protein